MVQHLQFRSLKIAIESVCVYEFENGIYTGTFKNVTYDNNDDRYTLFSDIIVGLILYILFAQSALGRKKRKTIHSP